MNDLAERMRHDLEEIGRTFMPFGKFGPAHFPPKGAPIYDIPAEYLGWFANRAGFPKGRLGELLRMVYQMKVDGSDVVFDPFRKKNGGRTELRPEKRKSWDFTE
ncbi:MAG: DUF3820 family protein [Verrucomicrobiaceae bacterium]|nr:DUF3820 family protein [Verrucomicrobiaceae bacterium]